MFILTVIVCYVQEYNDGSYRVSRLKSYAPTKARTI